MFFSSILMTTALLNSSSPSSATSTSSPTSTSSANLKMFHPWWVHCSITQFPLSDNTETTILLVHYRGGCRINSFTRKEGYSIQVIYSATYQIIQLKADRPHPRNYSKHRQTPETDNDSSLLFAALGKAEPLISTAARWKLDLDLRPWPMTLPPTFDLDPNLWPWP